ncbi:MAG: hypothetical protein NTW65_05160 [Deltaproteobacteria bacterium]|nr:hypothetical protein [Deltaproteobacteria bacterium]
MKKILLLAIAAIFMMMPVSAFAKHAITDGDLDNVTGQAGVSINFSNFTVGTTTMATMAFGDSDGFTDFASPGYFGANNVVINGGNTLVISGDAIVDVGSSGTATRINMVMPTLTLGPCNITANLRLDSTAALSTTTNMMGISMEKFTTSVTGTVQVFAH